MDSLEFKIQSKFDGYAERLPKSIDGSDSRLQALLSACVPLAGKKALDVGCGKGRFTAALIEKGAIATGVDYSEELLKEASKIKNGVFLQASATELPFKEESFDVVVSIEVIEHLPYLEKAIGEMCRVLKKGGVVAIIDRNKYSISNRRFMVPNSLIKRWHELRNQWIYPKDFPFRERRFSRGQVISLLRQYCGQVTAEYVESDGEKKCAWHGLFDHAPFTRNFILWRGVKR